MSVTHVHKTPHLSILPHMPLYVICTSASVLFWSFCMHRVLETPRLTRLKIHSQHKDFGFVPQRQVLACQIGEAQTRVKPPLQYEHLRIRPLDIPFHQWSETSANASNQADANLERSSNIRKFFFFIEFACVARTSKCFTSYRQSSDPYYVQVNLWKKPRSQALPKFRILEEIYNCGSYIGWSKPFSEETLTEP